MIRQMLAVAFLAAGISAQAGAADVTFAFSGRLTNVSSNLSSFFSTGDTFSGRYTFDDSALDSDPSPDTGTYTPAMTFSLNMGPLSFSSATKLPTTIYVSNFATYSYFINSALTNPGVVGSLGLNYWELALIANNGVALNSDALPHTAFPLALAKTATLEMYFGPPAGSGFAFGDLTSYALVSSIPEPGTYAMLLAGLGLLGFMARHRKQKEAA
jgi:hypothetical protein